MALIEYAAKYDTILQQHLSEGKWKHQRQFKMISTIAVCLRDKLLRPLKVAKFYCVIADEVTDYHSNQEILSLCVRCVDMLTEGVPCIKKIFLDFLYLERATGHAVATAILSLFAKHGHDASHIRRQLYDGASSMSGIKNGTQAIIQQKYPLTLCIHSRSHALNLAIAKSCSVQEIRNMIDVINETFLSSVSHQSVRDF